MQQEKSVGFKIFSEERKQASRRALQKVKIRFEQTSGLGIDIDSTVNLISFSFRNVYLTRALTCKPVPYESGFRSGVGRGAM